MKIRTMGKWNLGQEGAEGGLKIYKEKLSKIKVSQDYTLVRFAYIM